MLPQHFAGLSQASFPNELPFYFGASLSIPLTWMSRPARYVGSETIIRPSGFVMLPAAFCNNSLIASSPEPLFWLRGRTPDVRELRGRCSRCRTKMRILGGCRCNRRRRNASVAVRTVPRKPSAACPSFAMVSKPAFAMRFSRLFGKRTEYRVARQGTAQARDQARNATPRCKSPMSSPGPEFLFRDALRLREAGRTARAIVRTGPGCSYCGSRGDVVVVIVHAFERSNVIRDMPIERTVWNRQQSDGYRCLEFLVLRSAGN